MNYLLTLLLLLSLQQPKGGVTKAGAGGGGTPAFVNATSCTTGSASCTTGFSPTNGNRLYLWVVNDNVTTQIACSDGEGTGNTYTRDNTVDSNSNLRGSWFHSSSITGSGTYTITCTGTGANFAIHVIEVSGTTGTLASVSSGSNPSPANSAGGCTTGTSSVAPPSFTTTDANVILLDSFTDSGSQTFSSITQTDGSFTTRGTPCLNGLSCFIGAVGSRVVAATGTYSDGFTLAGATGSDCVGAHVAYK